MPDLPLVAHGFEEGVRAVLLVVEIIVDVELAHVVEEVEVEILHSALFQLTGEDLLRLAEVGHIVSRKLGGKTITAARIARKQFSHHVFGLSVVIAPCGVVVIDAVRHGIIHHLSRPLLVDVRIHAVLNGKAHRPEAKCGQFHILKISVNHIPSAAQSTRFRCA